MIHVYCADVSPLNEPGLFEQCLSRTSETRKEKIRRLRLQKDQNLCLGAGLLLDQGLWAYGLREKEMAYAYGENGKPVFPERPDVHFSLSHSGTMAAAALFDGEVGCDVERLRPVDDKLAARFFHPEEYGALLKAEPGAQRDELLCRIWTLKESFLKATGQGLGLRLDAFCIRFGEQRISVVQTAKETSFFFREFIPAPGYRGALCKRGEEEEVEVHFCTLTD